MANLNVEIPSLKLNDGTSIPLVGFSVKHALQKANYRSSAMEVRSLDSLRSVPSDRHWDDMTDRTI